MSLEIGQLIDGKYRIARLIGEGGMGAVYEGENIRINRRVAIKVLHAAFTGNKEVMQRFEREAQAAGRIGNDHILEVLDLGSLSDGDHFLVMEYLDGEPLSDRIKKNDRMTPHELTPIIRQVLVGLSAAHQAGIVHRDLKPDNIYILKQKAGKSDFVKIIDFGISKFQPLAGDGMKMTRTGAVMGTPYYMSPEQASGSHEADQRSDVYSVGVIMFEAVTGRVPFDAGTFNQLMFKIVLADVPRIESVRPELDAAFSSIVSKAMARDVTHRFQSAGEFIHALDEWMARGTAVSVPPAADAASSSFVPDGARAAMASNPGLAQTPAPNARTAGNWATSQPNPTPEGVPPKRSGLLVAAAAVGLLVVAGGAFAAFKGLSNDDPEPTDATAAQPASSPPAAPPPAPPEPELPQVKPEAIAAPQPSATTTPATGVSQKATSPSTGVVRPSVRPAAAAPPRPRPEPAKPATGKSKPASAPDFGY